LHVASDQAAKWRTVAARLAALHETGRSVLVGTRTVTASEAVATQLAARGLPFALLNARQDQTEAALVAEAGQAGRITIATNMAGRGTDILLGPGVAEGGGLHVLATELHDSRRVDRQLLGRAGRQGDPGTTEFVLALDDALLTDNAPRAARLLRALPEGALRARLALGLMRVVQRLVGRRHAEERRQLRKADEQEADNLAFIRN
jgi:preprotein translocase subunit SecA